MKATLAALCITLVTAPPARCEEPGGKERKARAIGHGHRTSSDERKRRDEEKRIEASKEKPREAAGQTPSA
jgi:hypothetical protein